MDRYKPKHIKWKDQLIEKDYTWSEVLKRTECIEYNNLIKYIIRENFETNRD